VEDVAGTGGVDDRDVEGWGVVEVLAVECEDSLSAEGGRGEPAAEAALHLPKCGLQVRFAGEPAGQIAADDEEVNVVEELFDAFVGVVEVCDDEHAGLMGPAGGEGGGGGVMAVDVKCSGVDDPLAVEFGGLEDEALVAAAEDGAFAGVIDEDE
jgi:hypothetical protein